jgi:hypothetical protein
MGSSDELGRLRLQALASRALLVTLFVLFAWANLRHWQETGRPSGLGTTALEAWAAVLFLTRRPTERVSRNAVAWIAAPVGSFAMLFARPSSGGLPALPCELLQLAGVFLALASLATLGRSFGLTAANRGAAHGPYRFAPSGVPGTSSRIAATSCEPHAANVALLVVCTGFQLPACTRRNSCSPAIRSTSSTPALFATG